MDDVICISTTDDEEDEPEKPSHHSNANGKSKDTKSCTLKRKLSPIRPECRLGKRPKIQDSKGVSRFKESSGKNSIFNKETKNKVEKCPSPKPGTSKESSNCDDKWFSKRETSKEESVKIKRIKPQLVVKEKVPIPEAEFDIFHELMKVCKERKDDEDTRKILKDVKHCYDKLSKKEVENEEFRLFFNSQIQKIINSSDMFKYILEIKEEIRRRIKKPKNTDKEKSNLEVDEEDDDAYQHLTKDQRKDVHKIQKAIIACKKKIKELEESEVNFEDDDNSAYIKEDRYKRRLVELCHKISEIVDDKELKKKIYRMQLRRKDIPDDMTSIESVDNAIIKFVNVEIKKVNKLKHIKNPNCIADFIPLPDLCDITKCIKTCDRQQNLDLSERKIEKMAKSAHKAIGHFLKKQRMRESHEYISSLIEDSNIDPAKKDSTLEEKLKKNKREGDKRLEEIFEKYVDRQLKLEPDDEMLKSDHGSDESEINDDEEKGMKIVKKPKRLISDSSSVEDAQGEVKKDSDLESVKSKKTVEKIESTNSLEKKDSDKKVDLEKADKKKKTVTVEISSDDDDDNNDVTISRVNSLSRVDKETRIEKIADNNPAIEDDVMEIDKHRDPLSATEYTERIIQDYKLVNSRLTGNSVDPLHLPSESDKTADSGEDKDDEVSSTVDAADNIEKEVSTADKSYLPVRQPLPSTSFSVRTASSSPSTSQSFLSKKPLPSIAQTAIVSPLPSICQSTSNDLSFDCSEVLDDSNNDCDLIIEETPEVSLVLSEPKLKESGFDDTPDDVPELLTEVELVPRSEPKPSFSGKPMLKLAPFAHLPAAWKDASPQKEQQLQWRNAPTQKIHRPPPKCSLTQNKQPTLQLPIHEALNDLWKPEYEDLTNEKMIKQATSTKLRNPLAINKMHRKLPAEKCVIVKGFNNHASPTTDTTRKSQANSPVTEKNKTSPLVGKKISDSSNNQRSNFSKSNRDIVRSSWLPSTKS